MYFLKINLIYVSLKVQFQHELKLYGNGESNILSNSITHVYPGSLYHEEILKPDSIPLRV